MKIQILGSGCPKCKKLASAADAAARAAGVDYTLEKVTDISDIMKFGVMMTPALGIDGEVKSVGKVLSEDQVRQLLDDAGAK